MGIHCRYGDILTFNHSRQKPSIKDIKQTKSLLDDFYITIDVPSFQTVGELVYWRKKVISESLDRCNNA